MIKIKNSKDIEALSETVEVECKLAIGQDGKGKLPSDFWPTYSSFANTHGGVILLGIKEKNRHFSIHGIHDTHAVITDLFNTLNNPSKVSRNLLTDNNVEIISIDSKNIIQITVPAAQRKQKPIYLNGNPLKNTYRRINESDLVCDDETVKRMLAEQIEDERDSRILSGFGIDDIDMDSFFAYRQMLNTSKKGHTWLEEDNEGLLKKLRGWRRDRQTGEEGLTLAGLLMFGRWEAIQEAVPNYFVDYQERAEAKTELRWIDRLVPDGTWSGNLFDFYRRVYRKLCTDLKVAFSIKDGQRLDDTPVHVALREALINTLVHADYSGRVSILVVKRPDLFGFRNPGKMRIPVEQAIQGGESDCRNRIIHQMFLMIGLGERAGSGVPKIFSGWKSNDWRPPALYEKDEPEQTLLELRMIDLFPLDIVQSLRNSIGPEYDKLGELERLILATAASEHVTTHNRIMEMSIAHASDLTQAFHRLIKSNLLKSKGHGRGTVYHLPGQNLPTPDQVFGESNVMSSLSGSEHFSGRSEHSQKSSEHLINNSEHSERSEQGYLIVPALQNPLIDDLNSLSQELKIELTLKSLNAQIKGKLPKNEMEKIILTLCDGHYLTLQVIASLIKRNPDALRQQYLKRLVNEGKLSYAFPLTPTHHKQAYITVQAQNDK